ncbi:MULTISPECIES: ABC-F family ATP-binding cassette domain-containing protein [unclassified Fusibacter]|uniref:ABC-F family ATP-binding cassette domain-containing protein n=1 Tax=unclassified Fusibacter TaxID=2624464 RepID=UPI001010BE5E|nr:MULTISPECIES: ABC-F family ATP-binding cassette domain-containing protein [unclassified Fusibacter]MCK8060029.1 ABC-F family ATP-binding cassette domain-containing protein [Fusibacter sp. A2]NPE22169.1 ABC-F family ATP-binding cassette domain-containing protein [Fusibacter sp. A1]RXV60945.1 ABC transporter ATP-binding protein [Fusibacter sp. A1]
MIIQIDNLSKSYAEKTLFSDISVTLTDGDKVGLIGVNGTGKSTFLKILSGYEVADTGLLSMPKQTVIAYLPQVPVYNEDTTVLEDVFYGDSEVMRIIREYEWTSKALEKDAMNEGLQARFTQLTDRMTALDAWSFESQVKTILSKLGVDNYDDKVSSLSGGQQKRIALARALITPSDLLILDEPTNHLDHQTVDWLETYLGGYKGALVMITHDRYFLDRVVNRTLELDEGSMYSYSGNYAQFLEKKLERKERDHTTKEKQAKLYKQELAWMRAGVQARRTKQKARKERFKDLESSLENKNDIGMSIDVGHRRLGTKTIEMEQVTFSYGNGVNLIDGYDFLLDRNDRLGIIGQNGMGKSTFLNVLTGKLKPTSGKVSIGETVSIGYFTQHASELPPEKRAIDFIKDIAEFVTTASGAKITASQMMERFLFDKNLQWNPIGKLSGGERRRLYLLSVLMATPNVLILDEPTNDLDIDTMTILEAYLDEFSGAVIAVSHDRYFLDRVCDRVMSFEQIGQIRMNTGNYSDYMNKWQDEQNALIKTSEIKTDTRTKNVKLKMTYKEQKEFEALDGDIANAEERLTMLDDEMVRCATDFVRLQHLQEEKDALEEVLLTLLERQEYLDDLNERIKSQ